MGRPVHDQTIDSVVVRYVIPQVELALIVLVPGQVNT